jgi:hypothetical protein
MKLSAGLSKILRYRTDLRQPADLDTYNFKVEFPAVIAGSVNSKMSHSATDGS